MKLGDVGERELLMLAKDICEEGSEVQVGIGDDAAAIKLDDHSVVVSTDMLIENIHFGSETNPEAIGRKAVVVNLSDLAAMGAEPLGMVFSIGAPKDKELEFISRLLKALNSTVRQYDTQIVGGDLNESSEVILSGTAMGIADSDKLLLRSGAEAGDFVGVTGNLGASTSITMAQLSDIFLGDWPSLERAALESGARLKEGRILSGTEGVHSAIDITDGLAANLWQLSRMSEVSLIVDWSDLPIHEGAVRFSKERDFDLEDLVLYGGEDFELLFTAAPESWETLKERFSEIDTNLVKIGEVMEGEGVRIRKGEGVEELPDRGYEHFA